MNSQFLIIPIPPTKNKCATTIQAINTAFGGNAPEIVSLAERVKQPQPDEEAFRNYLPMLGALVNANVPTCYTSPFKTSETFESNEGSVEVINTLWNFLSYLHHKLLTIDCGNEDHLREFRPIMADCHAIADNLYKAVTIVSHPFFTPQVVDYLKAYHKYIITIWQIAILQVSGKNKQLIARQALTAVKEINAADQIARSLNEPMRSYFQPISTATLAFYQGFAYFNNGGFYMNKKEIKEGIQSFRTACRFVTRSDYKLEFAPTLANALTSMKRACLTSKEAAEDQNREIYMVRVPDGDPELKPLPAQVIEPNTALYINQFFADELAMMEDDPWGDNPNPPKPTDTSGGSNPPPDLPNDGIVDDPWNSNPYGAPPPSVVNDPSPWNSQPPAEEEPFPVWEIVMNLKQQVNDKARKLLNNPQWRAEAEKVMQQLGLGAKADDTIQNKIREYKIGNPSMTKDNIERDVQQAMQFYSNMEAKLNRFK